MGERRGQKEGLGTGRVITQVIRIILLVLRMASRIAGLGTRSGCSGPRRGLGGKHVRERVGQSSQ